MTRYCCVNWPTSIFWSLLTDSSLLWVWGESTKIIANLYWGNPSWEMIRNIKTKPWMFELGIVFVIVMCEWIFNISSLKSYLLGRSCYDWAASFGIEIEANLIESTSCLDTFLSRQAGIPYLKNFLKNQRKPSFDESSWVCFGKRNFL